MTVEAWEDKISKPVTGAQLSSELMASPLAFFSLMASGAFWSLLLGAFLKQIVPFSRSRPTLTQPGRVWGLKHAACLPSFPHPPIRPVSKPRPCQPP